MPLYDPDPEWFDRPGGALVAVAVSAALCVAVCAIGWGDWTGASLIAAGAALVALGLSLSNLRDARRRVRRSVQWFKLEGGTLDIEAVPPLADDERAAFVEDFRSVRGPSADRQWIDDGDDSDDRPRSAP